jgi:hypothetical protein
MLKNKMLPVIVVAILTLVYVASHTDLFVSYIYERKIVRECGVDIMCRLGAGLMESPMVFCMEDKAISWSESTFSECLDKVQQQFNK